MYYLSDSLLHIQWVITVLEYLYIYNLEGLIKNLLSTPCKARILLLIICLSLQSIEMTDQMVESQISQ